MAYDTADEISKTGLMTKMPYAHSIPRSRILSWVALALAFFVFVLDLILLHGQAEAVLYVVVVLLFLWSAHWNHVLYVAAGCTLLTVLGYILMPQAFSGSAQMLNHSFAIIAIWLTAILGLQMNRMTDKLAGSESRLKTILESVAEGIVTIDSLGNIETSNGSAAEMFGYCSTELFGKNIETLMPSEIQQTHDLGEGIFLNTEQKRMIESTREVTALRKDGTHFPLLISVNELKFDSQQSFVAVLLDMTELRSAQQLAIQSERLAAIGGAMTGLAHESRNALQRGQAAVEMLGREIDDRPEAVDLLGRIQIAQNDLHSLYEEVRGYAASIKLNITPARLDHLVSKAWQNLVVAREGRSATLVIEDSTEDLSCEMDPFVIVRTFRNLFENSLAAGVDPVQITVQFDEQDAGHSVCVSVRDNGPGMSQEVCNKLFEPFFTTKSRGTGLGMSLAMRYIHAHGGSIDVEGNPGQGAVFQITLPRKQS